MEMTLKKLHELANSLKFKMKEEEYCELLAEFKIIIAQMNLLNDIDGIDEYSPMTFALDYPTNGMCEDEEQPTIKIEELLSNVKEHLDNQIKLPKVVN